MHSTHNTAEPQKPVTDVYFIAIDLMLDHKKELKVLEIQSIYESNTDIEVCRRNPAQELLKKILPDCPTLLQEHEEQLKIRKQATNNAARAYAKKASVTLDRVMINRGIEPICEFKWHFYYFCKAQPKLQKYIAETHLVNLYTVSERFKYDQNKNYLCKPADGSRGKGIHKLPNKKYTAEELNSFFTNYFKDNNNITHKIMFEHYPFIIQNNLDHDNNRANPIIRVFAAILVKPPTQNQSSRFSILIDESCAYQSTRNILKADSYTPANKTYKPYRKKDIKNLTPKVEAFLHEFFSCLFNNKNHITYKGWLESAKYYMKNYHVMEQSERMLVISQFAFLLLQEQALANNQISLQQSLILEGFLNKLAEEDIMVCKENNLLTILSNSFKRLAENNLIPYCKLSNYQLSSVFQQYLEIVLKHSNNEQDMATYKQISAATKHQLPEVKFAQNSENHILFSDSAIAFSIFNHLPTQTLNQMALVAKGSLHHLLYYQRK